MLGGRSEAVPLAGWRYEIEPQHERGRPGCDRRTVQVTLRYALSAVDPAPTARPLVLTFAGRAGRWLIDADDARAADGTRTWRGPQFVAAWRRVRAEFG